jgi:ABC-type uncharacterized transport system substrate-binding protein
MLVFSASSESEIEAAFANMAQQQVGALIGGSDTYCGLMAYGNSVADMYLLVGNYVGRILKGEKPSDLPVQALRPSSRWSST